MSVISEIKKKSKNLFDVSKAETGSLVAVDGSNYEANNRVRSPFVYLKKGTYAISMDSQIRATTMFFYSQPQASGYFIGKYATTPIIQNGRRVATFPVEQDCYLRCVFIPEDETIITDLSAETLSKYNVMIEMNKAVTDYQPYGYLDVKKFNNKTIREIVHKNNQVEGLPNGTYHFAKQNEVTGKNLFDINNIEEGSILTLSGEDYNIENRYRLKYTFMKAGTYTLAINGNVQGGGYLHKYSKPNAESWINTVPFSTMKTINGRNIRTATLDEDCYVRFVFLSIGNQILSKEYLLKNKPQLELNSTATDYEIFSGYDNKSRICEDAVNEPIVDMQLKGNLSQDGTPTPETPIEIESIGHLGKNLCGGRNLLVNQLIGNSANGVIVDSTVYNTMYIEVEEGETYSFTGFVRADGTSLKGCYYDSNGAWVSAFEETTVTIPTGVKFVGRSFNKTVAEVQFEKGQPTEYEPYGYRIPVTAKGENMADLSQKPNETSSSFTYVDGVYTVANSVAYKPNRWKITLKPNTKYIVSAESINFSKGFVQISGYFSGTGIVGGSISLRDSSLTDTFTTTDDGVVTLSIYTSELVENFVVKDIQIREILETTNIMVDEPLRKIGNYSDYLDLKNKTIVRKIASEFIDTVQFVSGDASTYKKFLTNIKYKPYLTGTSVQAKGYAISNKFKQSTVVYNEMGSYPNLIQTYITTGGVNRVVYTFDDSSITTISQAQPLIGDGFEVCYVMANTIEETIEVPEIMTLDGTTTLEIDTNVEPTGLSVTYWKQI